MLCYICQKDFRSIRLLVFHFKHSHNLKTNSIFRCCEANCSQIFKNLSSFKKHLRHKHVTDEDTDNEFEIQDCIDDTQHNTKFDASAGQSTSLVSNYPVCMSYDNINETKTPEITEIKNSTILEFQIEESLKKIINSAAEFVLTLHNNNNFSRNDVFKIQEYVNKCLIDPLLDVMKSFANNKLEVNSSIHNEFCNLILNCRNPFKFFNTEHMLYKWLKNENYIESIQEFTIDNTISAIHRKGSFIYDEKEVKGVLMPLRFQITKIFEKGDLLKRTLDNIEFLQKCSVFKNFVQGKLWKQKIKLYPNKILMPYFLYLDDLEINNPLGSNSTINSICNVYYSFPGFPAEESKLENVFFGAIIKCTDIKNYGNEKCFQTLINELKDLEINGIDIKVDENSTLRVYFILGLVLGDNLGLNSFLDFNKSFSSNFYCRLCKAKKVYCQTLTTENKELLRTIVNYDKDLKVNNSQNTGIKNNSLLNSIPSFHVVENYYMDVMHDIFEGVCHYNLCNAITYFIKMKYFDLDILNSRKQSFEYGSKEIENISGEITSSHLEKKHLKMSAAEMMTFIMHFPLMIGDLVSADDEVWNFLINFIEIIDIILCFEIDEENILLLENKIIKHNSDYIKLFNDTLKPKFHNLTHYATIIRQSGPVRKIWCFKYEAKHRQFKIYSHCITSRKNICLTLSKKYQLKFAYQLIKMENPLTTIFTVNEKHEISSNYHSIIIKKLNANEKDIKLYSSIEYKSVKYNNKNNYIATFESDIKIYLILVIILFQNNVLFFCQKLQSLQYRQHFLAYEIDATSLGQFSIISPKDVIGPPFTLIKTAKGKSMIRLKKYYKIV